MNKFRGLDRGVHTDEEVLLVLDIEQLLHLFGMVVRSVDIDYLFELASVDSKIHRIIYRTYFD